MSAWALRRRAGIASGINCTSWTMRYVSYLGGIAKGYAVDLAVQALLERECVGGDEPD